MPRPRRTRGHSCISESPEQAERGARIFERARASCHSAGSEAAPPEGLSGPDFIRRWHTVAGLYNKFRWPMPADDPISLDVDDDLDVTAYLLRQNGFPEGRRPRVDDAHAMKGMALASSLAIDIDSAIDVDTADALRLREGFHTGAARQGILRRILSLLPQHGICRG